MSKFPTSIPRLPLFPDRIFYVAPSAFALGPENVVGGDLDFVNGYIHLEPLVAATVTADGTNVSVSGGSWQTDSQGNWQIGPDQPWQKPTRPIPPRRA